MTKARAKRPVRRVPVESPEPPIIVTPADLPEAIVDVLGSAESEESKQANVAALLRQEFEKLEVKAEATGEATRAEGDPISLLEADETVLAIAKRDYGVTIVTSYGRRFVVDPDGWISQDSGPDLCVLASGEDLTESADARAD